MRFHAAEVRIGEMFGNLARYLDTAADVFEDPAAAAKTGTLFWYLPGYSAFHSPSVMARKGDWKLIRSLEDDDYQLFQTAKDIGETRNRALTNSPIGEGLNQAAMDWLDATKAPRMTPNPDYDPDAR